MKMRFHIFAAIFIVGTLLHSTPSVHAFRDVTSGNRYSEAISYLQQKNMVQGYSDGTFQPDKFISRAEFLKIVYLATTGFDAKEFEDAKVCRHGLPYSDVAYDAWYHVYLCSVGSSLSGYPDGTFKPDLPINFAEAAKIITTTIQIEKQHLSTPRTGDNPWYKKYVVFLEREHAIPLEITRLDQQLTRGQMAEIMYLLMFPKNSSKQTYTALTGEQVTEKEYDHRVEYTFQVDEQGPTFLFIFYPETGNGGFVAPPNETMAMFQATYSSEMLRSGADDIAAGRRLLTDYIVLEDIDDDGKNELLLQETDKPATYTVWKYGLSARGNPWMTSVHHNFRR